MKRLLVFLSLLGPTTALKADELPGDIVNAAKLHLHESLRKSVGSDEMYRIIDLNVSGSCQNKSIECSAEGQIQFVSTQCNTMRSIFSYFHDWVLSDGTTVGNVITVYQKCNGEFVHHSESLK
jgi:hypothetical protein